MFRLPTRTFTFCELLTILEELLLELVFEEEELSESIIAPEPSLVKMCIRDR